METQDKLEKGIGTKEPVSLSPSFVRIVNVRIEMQKTKEGKEVGDKLICSCKHPAKEELIEISSVKHENKASKLIITGLWYKEDADKNIQKGSALSSLLIFAKAKNSKELIGKDLQTITDDRGYLCFKAY